MNESTVKISIPGNHLMPGLFGERDLHLKSIEAAFPDATIHAVATRYQSKEQVPLK